MPSARTDDSTMRRAALPKWAPQCCSWRECCVTARLLLRSPSMYSPKFTTPEPAGTSIASEIGLMGATDQFAAMEMMAVDPVRLVIAPRFLGGLVAMPLLTAIFTCTGIFGGHLFGVTIMGIESGTYWSQMQSAVQLHDVTEGLLKSALFGVTCSLIAVYEGFHAEPTAAGVALATTRTVVGSTVFTLILDYLLTAAFI
jgi:phospholipid/cholesterol/gamma-HCH transport system permease protein